MKWLLKNIGLVACGLCFLAGSVEIAESLRTYKQNIDQRLVKIEVKLDKATAYNAPINQLAAVIPGTALRMAR